MDAKIEDRIDLFSRNKEKADQIKAFLNKGFSSEGQEAVLSLFLVAGEYYKPIEVVLPKCQKEWERVWRYQSPQIRGDIFLAGEWGRQNKIAFKNIYYFLGLPFPAAVR